MYCYIYDEFLQEKRFEKDILQIENRLTDLGIAGKVLRLALFRDAREMVLDEARRGATTMVVIGNDLTARKVLDVVADAHSTFGMIPMGTPNELAQLLGLPSGIEACDVLSARIVERVDVGVMNGRRFLSRAVCESFSGSIAINGEYRLIPQDGTTVSFINLGETGLERTAEPKDAKIDVMFESKAKFSLFGRKQSRVSLLRTEYAHIRCSDPMTFLADGETITEQEFEVGMRPMALSVITGKGRMFE